jgi:hypothetical protein
MSLLRPIGHLSYAALAVLIAACGSASDPSGTGGPAPVTCFDAAGKSTTTCAVTPVEDLCSLGDANSCVTASTVAVYADDGKNGVCLHLIYENNCPDEIFADTCIEHISKKGAKEWQCWTSSVLPGFPIDVDQCQATGRYFEVASKSSSQLDIDEMKCPAPM